MAEKKASNRFIGKVRQKTHKNRETGEAFTKLTILINNPNPENDDGTPNKYFKGALVWMDAETGKNYQIKQLSLAGVTEGDSEKGFLNSLKIDLDDEYQVQELPSGS